MAAAVMSAHITWIRVSDHYPDLVTERDHFLALDGTEAVGIVRLVEGEGGPDSERWRWSMVQVRPGQPFPHPRTGTGATRSEATRALVECWRVFRRYYGLEDAR